MADETRTVTDLADLKSAMDSAKEAPAPAPADPEAPAEPVSQGALVYVALY